MADELEIPDSAEQLYLARGDEVSEHRPFCQGDVFDSTPIPGVDDDPTLAIVTTHACDMRGDDGVELAERLHLARVEARPDPPPLPGWFKHHPKEMPLPELHGPGSEHFTAQLDLVGRVKTTDLGPRIACLLPYGVTILQQRIVNRASRVQIANQVFHERSAPLFEELDLMEEWIEASQGYGTPRADAEHAFHELIREKRKDEPPLQDQLREEGKRPHVARVVREAIAVRFRGGTEFGAVGPAAPTA
jgi:hypothetical protein